MWKRKLWEQCAAFLCHSGSHPPLPCSAFKQKKTGKLMGWGPEVTVCFTVSWGGGWSVHSQHKHTTVMQLTLPIHISELLHHHLMSVKSWRAMSGKRKIKTVLHCPLLVQTGSTLSKLQSYLRVQNALVLPKVMQPFFYIMPYVHITALMQCFMITVFIYHGNTKKQK